MRYNRGKIITAQIGAAKGRDAEAFEAEATRHCDLIMDDRFWHGLETVIGDIEPICYGTNINQKDSTRADQVLLTVAGIFLHFESHPEPEVASGMVKDIEKRWKDCDQPIFLLSLILNPFEKLSCFGPNAKMDHFRCGNLLIQVWLSHFHNVDFNPVMTRIVEVKLVLLDRTHFY